MFRRRPRSVYKRTLAIDGELVSYTIRNAPRARAIRIRVTARGKVLVTKPRYVSRARAVTFVDQSSAWIGEELQKHEARVAQHPQIPYTKKIKEQALQLVEERLHHFNKHYQLPVGTIRIRNQSTRWGSCSRHGNLSFNYRIITLSSQVADYLVVHELCHIAELNHSQKFWNLVAETISSYAALRRAIHKISLS